MNNDSHAHHIVPLRIYLAIGTILLILTAITVSVSFIDLGGWNVVIALLIASFKASLVALYFMHLRYDSKFYMIIFLVAIIFLTIFIGFIMLDTLRRSDFYPETGQPINKQAIIYRDSADSLAVPTDSAAAIPENDH